MGSRRTRAPFPSHYRGAIEVTEEDGRALWRLRNRWLGAYQVALSGGLWLAVRHGGAEPLAATTAHELGQKIQADYGTLRCPN